VNGRLWTRSTLLLPAPNPSIDQPTLFAPPPSWEIMLPLAVTTNLNINFLRKPVAHAPIRARAALLKVGRTMGVGEVFVYSDGMEDPVAHSTMTYSIPPEKYQN